MIKNILFGSSLIESTSAHIGLAILRIYPGRMQLLRMP